MNRKGKEILGSDREASKLEEGIKWNKGWQKNQRK